VGGDKQEDYDSERYFSFIFENILRSYNTCFILFSIYLYINVYQLHCQVIGLPHRKSTLSAIIEPPYSMIFHIDF